MKGLPTFPAYHGPPLPQTLNPLNPRHYLLLLKWIWFQPSRLKHYLHQADPDLYRALGPGELRQSWRLPAYRHLYLISIILILLLSGGLAGIISAVLGTPLDWRGVIFGAAAGLVFGAAFVIVGGMAFGVASGPVFGVPFGVIFGVSFGVVFAVASGVAFVLTGSAGFGVVGGVAFGIALGVALAMAVGVTFGMAAGVALTSLLILGLCLAFVIAFVVAGGEVVVVAFVVAVAMIAAAGGSRLLLYPIEWLLARFQPRSRHDPFQALVRHPALWNELTVWPLPGTAQLLQSCLDQDLSRGLRLALRIAISPFQRCAVQRALSDFLASRPDALAAVYHLAHVSMLDEYLVPPSRRHQFRSYRSARLVLMGELGQCYVAASSEATENTEYLVWRFTRRWRQMEKTPLSQFCFLLYELFRKETDLETADPQEIKLRERFESTYEGVRHLKHGVEVAGSFATIAAFLDVGAVDALATARRHLAWTDDLLDPPLRPEVVEALKALGDVSQEVFAFVRATNTGQKSAALNRAAGELNELAGYVRSEVLAPERVLLDRAIELWKSIIAAEQGRLGEAALQEMAPAARRAAGILQRTSSAWQRPARPFDNPYIVGDPVYPPLLVGRKDVFDRIDEVWSAKKNPDSIIIYGHRRMGKSSILRNLDQVAPQGSVVVYADMAGETSFVESTTDLLLALADKIYIAVRRSYGDGAIPEPDPEAYTTQARAQFQLNRLLEGVRETLDGRILVLALDEFEGVERAVEEGKIGREIYQFLRAKTQEPWLALVFGGLHTLDEMSRDYQQPFYGSYENIPVSYLTHPSAWRLITNPTEDFELNYEHEAIERVIAETGGQPYLVQQICRDALDHLNHELFDLELEREVCITVADVEAVLDDDFFRRGTVYFDGVWTQAGDRDQRMLLRVMAGQDEPWMQDELETATGLDAKVVHRQLRWAERHDIICRIEPDQWGFHVPLMRRWTRRGA
jgi:AAA+ ATPase superfamily predicted ATPase